ncbi:MAG: YdcF family protein [bacterium]|nr:YdcF family protein [bacterium]
MAILILGLSVYLGPDDLRNCPNIPSGAGQCKKSDVIVAVSGGDTTARTDEAVERYKAGWAPYIIFSGAARDTSGPSNAEVMRDQAVQAGVDSSDIFIDSLSNTTKENAEDTESIIKRNGFKRIILVTSKYHQRRASLEFKRVLGPEVTIINHPVASDNQWSSVWWLTPVGWYLAISEFLKVIVFYIGGTV